MGRTDHGNGQDQQVRNARPRDVPAGGLRMAGIVSANAYANNEVVFIAWDVDGKIDGCLGFDVTRVYLNPDGTVATKADGTEDRVRCAAWVAFEGQRNPHWIAQDTGTWPIQKTSWRDLTVRKKRDNLKVRPAEAYVRYEIRPIGDLKPGLEPAPDPTPATVTVSKKDKDGKPEKGADGKVILITAQEYEGEPRPLGYLGPAVSTNPVLVSSRRGKFRSTFTNGILAAQWLKNVLLEDGKIEPNELLHKIQNPKDPHRKYLAGDVLPLLHEFFERPGEFYLALYELEDEELIDLLVTNTDRIHLILANTGVSKKKWDERNAPARQKLIDEHADIQHRMFNNSGHIGHNKFVVHVPPGGGPRSVLTGSTNWTFSGIAGQSNNAIVIEDDAVAAAYLAYWERLDNDKLPLPDPLSAEMKKNYQGKPFRKSNEIPANVEEGDGKSVRVWFSPNMQPVSVGKKTPPDLEDVYRLMRLAKDAILFLAYYPSQRGNDSIISEAIDIGRKDGKLIVTGAVSSSMAMPNYKGKGSDSGDEGKDDSDSPRTFTEGNVLVVRGSRIEDNELFGDFGMEQQTAYGSVGAIIHDKIVVIDPLSPDCTVILGSHNLGFRASYCNDENLVIVQGDMALAQAYAVHVLDVYDHYRFRAREAELKKQKKKGWSGFLETDDSWMDEYVDGAKGALTRYFAKRSPAP